jgi:hypothetical protein
MITKTTGFTTSDGAIHATIKDAQVSELATLLEEAIKPSLACGVPSDLNYHTLADAILPHREKLIDILTTTAKSRVRARKSNGGTKTRKPKSVVAQFNEIAKESADVMRQRIADGKGLA